MSLIIFYVTLLIVLFSWALNGNYVKKSTELEIVKKNVKLSKCFALNRF